LNTHYEALFRDHIATGMESEAEDNSLSLSAKNERGQMSFICQ